MKIHTDTSAEIFSTLSYAVEQNEPILTVCNAMFCSLTLLQEIFLVGYVTNVHIINKHSII